MLLKQVVPLALSTEDGVLFHQRVRTIGRDYLVRSPSVPPFPLAARPFSLCFILFSHILSLFCFTHDVAPNFLPFSSTFSHPSKPAPSPLRAMLPVKQLSFFHMNSKFNRFLPVLPRSNQSIGTRLERYLASSPSSCRLSASISSLSSPPLHDRFIHSHLPPLLLSIPHHHHPLPFLLFFRGLIRRSHPPLPRSLLLMTIQ